MTIGRSAEKRVDAPSSPSLLPSLLNDQIRLESILSSPLTDRQQRELDYHREHAKEHKRVLSAPFDWDVLKEPKRRWWNAYWQMYAYLLALDLRHKNVLVVGCGFGDDALRLAKLGAKVSAFDLSPHSLQIARDLAAREGLEVDFQEMPAEQMTYADCSFDLIVARDILHHVDIPLTMKEIQRVARPDALFVVNEIYSHSATNMVRHSTIVEKFIYPRMRKMIYGTGKPYITEDERKLSEMDLKTIKEPLASPEFFSYFNFLSTRIVPGRIVLLAKLDRLVLQALRPFGSGLAGRILFSAKIRK